MVEDYMNVFEIPDVTIDPLDALTFFEPKGMAWSTQGKTNYMN